jgi:hypothetical protein
MSAKRTGVAIAFALAAVLGLIAVTVLDGAAAAAAAFGSMLVFILACIGALRRQDAATRREADRVGLAGWFGGWF